MAEIFYDKNALISTILIFRRMLFPSSHTGKINSYYALKTFGVNAQPYYVLQGRDGKTLVPPRGYDLNVENFVQFLRSGIEAYKKQQ